MFLLCLGKSARGLCKLSVIKPQIKVWQQPTPPNMLHETCTSKCAQNTSLSVHPPQWTKCQEITKPVESPACHRVVTGRFNISDSLWEYTGSPQFTTIYLMTIQNDKNWTYDWSSQSQPIAACLQSNDQHSGLANWHEFMFAASQGHVITIYNLPRKGPNNPRCNGGSWICLLICLTTRAK